MQADWYVDPLGRYEGRYFDGDEWTEQVKERGRLVIDPDWNRPDELAEPIVQVSGVDLGGGATAAGSAGAFAGRAAGLAGELDQLGRGVAARQGPLFDARDTPAVEPLRQAPVVDATGLVSDVDIDIVDQNSVDYRTESPARQVAVLETAPHETASLDAVDLDAQGRGGRRWFWLIGAAVVLAGLLLALLPRLTNDDESATDSDTAVSQDEPSGAELPATSVNADEDTVQTDGAGDNATNSEASGSVDAETGGTAGTEQGPDPDAIQVGSLNILNGQPMLRDLAAWHASSLEGRDVELGPEAGCWYGAIGNAVVQNAHCGPVARTPGAEPRFDLIPLRFEDISSGVIQTSPVTDAIVTDAVLPTGIELVGLDGPVEVTAFAGALPNDTDPDDAEPAEAGTRGTRSSGD